MEKRLLTGLKKLIHGSRVNEVIYFPSDKSDRMLIDSLPDNVHTMQLHLSDTHEVTLHEYDRVEKLLSPYIGCNILPTKRRASLNFQADNNEVPTLYGLRKDYKPTEDQVVRTPTKPVCGVNTSSNYRTSMIVNPLIEASPDVCESTEELLRHLKS